MDTKLGDISVMCSNTDYTRMGPCDRLYNLKLEHHCCFSFSSKRSDGHDSNGTDESQNKQTAGDKMERKMNVSERQKFLAVLILE